MQILQCKVNSVKKRVESEKFTENSVKKPVQATVHNRECKANGVQILQRTVQARVDSEQSAKFRATEWSCSSCGPSAINGCLASPLDPLFQPCILCTQTHTLVFCIWVPSYKMAYPSSFSYFSVLASVCAVYPSVLGALL